LYYAMEKLKAPILLIL